MPDIAAANVTVTEEATHRSSDLRQKRNRVKIVFGDGALTYPSGGVPMPAIGEFGMVNSLDQLVLFDSDDATGIAWKYDSENKKMRGYEVSYDPTLTSRQDESMVELDAGVDTPAVQTLHAEAVGW